MEDNFQKTVLKLYRDNKWRDILELNADSKNDVALKLLWVWPSLENLKYIKNKLFQFNLNGIISVGCGCGLLEWILQKYIKCPVLGYEVNKTWWDSKYSNPLFIPHVYPDEPITENILNSEFALLFCYFNNGPAFIDYVRNYKGRVIFIIGPGEGSGRHTNPAPFKADFGEANWKLFSYQEVKWSNDFIAVYIRPDNFM